ncbi:hypothetical protein EYR36_001892 [Pleurotus pulmonarius]|nr:hypothetical protein EYR36_001892 [Pleurotus pulmonarius]KAF4588354.1 hypothetical protein EYR38_010322 [Pleurotus pulmonarius]
MTLRTSMPELPVELVLLIIDNIDDKPTILKCLTLSHSLSHHAERALYSRVSFVVRSCLPGPRSALPGFRAAIKAKPHLQKITTHFTARILVNFGRYTPFYLDLNEILARLTNLTYLSIHGSSSSQNRSIDFAAIHRASTGSISLKTLICDDVSVPRDFIMRQSSLRHLEVHGSMLGEFKFAGPSHPTLRTLRLPSEQHSPSQSTSMIGEACFTPAKLGLEEREWKAVRETISDRGALKSGSCMITWVRKWYVGSV